MSTTNTDVYNLKSVPTGNDGMVNEDVMQKIYDISPVDRPFCDSIGTTSADNTYKEWLRESLTAASPDNATIDGADAGTDQSKFGERYGNYHQLMSKVVRVSDRGRDVNSIGSSDELVRQLMKQQKSLKRDEESALTSHNAALVGDSATASKMAGLGAWIGVKVDGAASTTSDRGATGLDPVLNGTGGDGGAPTTAAVAGTTRALSEAIIRDMIKQAYLNGGEVSMAMSSPSVIEKFSSYLFTSSARVATLQSDVSQSNRGNASSGNGNSGGGVSAQGAVNIFVSDFSTLELVPNRFQPNAATDNDSLFLIDPSTWEKSYLSGYRTKDLARTGTAENRQITVDASLCALNPEGNAIIADIDPDIAMVA